MPHHGQPLSLADHWHTRLSTLTCCADWMTNQTPPPPTEQDANPTLTAHSSLTHIIQDLRDLVFNIALPKTEKAKMAKVPTNTLHLFRGLAESAFTCISAQGPPSNSNESTRLDALDRQIVTRRARVIRARGQVGSASEFGRTWLQRVGRCADSSFSSRISVTDRGLVARCDGGEGSEEGNYECGVGSVTRR